MNIFILDEIVSYYWDYNEEPEEMHDILFRKCMAAFEEHISMLGMSFESYDAIIEEYK